MFYFSKKYVIFLLLLPTSLLLITYTVIPVMMTFGYSLTDYYGQSIHINYVGIKNYIELFKDHNFFIALKNTGIVLVIKLGLCLPLSFLFGMMLNLKLKGMGIIKTINFTPVVMAPISIALIWLFILDPNMGLFNQLLKVFGVQHNIQWIGGKTLTPFSIGVVEAWKSLGLLGVIFLAGLKLIPNDVYEASKIDGATKAQQTWYITIPLLKETVKICTVLLITSSFKVFETVFLLTGGGPMRLSEVMTTYLYNTIFGDQLYGYGMAMALILFILTMMISIVFLKLTQKEVD